MKKILLFGAGKSATVLIDYLVEEAAINDWFITVADANKEQVLSKTKNSPLTKAVQIDITNDRQRGELIEESTIVISMMPPTLHFLIAKDCVEYGKHLLTASYLDNATRSLQTEVQNRKILFLCEMGLDPGIDHMSAMELVDRIRLSGGTVTSFKSHCGGLVAPESDNNPWHYKISWNPRNVVLAGKAGAEYKLNNEIHHKEYKDLFTDCTEVDIIDAGTLSIYPNRDSLAYMPVYKLEDVKTFVRTTLRYPSFCRGWNAIVQGGLADDTNTLQMADLNFKKWSALILPFVNDTNREMLEFLGLFDEAPVPASAGTSADILQYLLETRLAMEPHDKDMVVMMHEIEYLINNTVTRIESSLVVKGEDSLRTAMAKTVGLPLGIAAKLILDGTIALTGIHIPTAKEIYDPVLLELKNAGISFVEQKL